jgi:hypothetical protein
VARYVSTEVPITDLPNTQRWLREEYAGVFNSTEDIYKLSDILVSLYTVAGYGGIGLDAITALSDINATPQILPFDVETLPNPRGITYSLGSNGLIFETEGVWRINAKVSLEFAEAQAGRRLQLRMYNVNTASDVGPSFNFGVGRNIATQTLIFNLAVEIPESIIGDTLILRILSTADVFTSVVAIGSIWDTNHVSEYKGDLFDDEQKILGA